MSIPEGNINTYLGVGYNAEGQRCSNVDFGGGTIVPAANPTSNIGMPLQSSTYPIANTIGVNPYQPIEIVGAYDIPANTTNIVLALFEYDPNPYDGIFPPYSQIEIEGVLHRKATRNNISDDFCFFNITFQTNFYPNNTATVNQNNPSSITTIEGQAWVNSNSQMIFLLEDLFGDLNKYIYYVQLHFTSKTYPRKLLTHTTFL
tara:strand:- start:1247 stop:1855 length:609 start_codon:yes stop_codon:yes gene_type:complete